jgi:putative aminopeptidase FrvX
MNNQYVDFAVEKLKELISIDSPTGYTSEASDYVLKEFENLGFKSKKTNKGGILVDLGGEDADNALLIEAHIDTLGAVVAEIKWNGRLRVSPLGGMNANNAEAENVRVYTRNNQIYEGTFQLINASIHVNGEYNSTSRTFETSEVVLDEDVKSAEDVKKLGIDVGDIVCFAPRFKVTKNGYIKSRFLDDKLSVAIILGLAKNIKEEKIKLSRKVYIHLTVYEEVGHGGSASVPLGVTEALSVDMGCVGNGLNCTEKQVSICVKDSGGPYDYGMISRLVDAAKKTSSDYALDVYPHYGSDVEATLRGGYDIRHALIGAGVYASHGYERSHIEGVKNTLNTLLGFLVE